MSLIQAIKEAAKVSIQRHRDKHKKYGMFCIECDKRLVPDEVYVEDFGIGVYEYFGDKGFDVQLHVLHCKCAGDVVDTKTNLFIRPDDVR